MIAKCEKGPKFEEKTVEDQLFDSVKKYLENTETLDQFIARIESVEQKCQEVIDETLKEFSQNQEKQDKGLTKVESLKTLNNSELYLPTPSVMKGPHTTKNSLLVAKGESKSHIFRMWQEKQ